MPAYGTVATYLPPGVPIYMFNGESPSAPAASIAVTRVQAGTFPGTLGAVTFQLSFAASPTASVEIQGSMVDSTAAWAIAPTLHTTTTQNDSYTDTGAWLFYRIYVASESGGYPLSVIVARI